jgi:glutamate N-acetyltransferase / amino-acid N-acetyltransferase
MTTSAKPSELDFLPIPGIRLGAAAAEIRYRGRNDLLLIELAEGATCAAVFTRNAFCAAPVVLARRHLAAAPTAFLLINSGNANAGTGALGMHAAEESCRALAALRGCRPEQVLPFSTGVIGEPLPVNRLAAGLPAALTALSERGWAEAARAIMTTDTLPKLVSRQIELDGRSLSVTGIAKGSGMIKPDMATMLAYIATDAAVPQALLQQCLNDAVEPSFNAITVDGDTSTNDACVLMATGQGNLAVHEQNSPEFQVLSRAVTEVCMELARRIIKDGEGATKLIEVRVEGARDRAEARQVGYTIAHSPLVKTAIFAADPNWGRILAAVGRAGVAALEIDKVRIWLDDVNIVRDGGRAPDYTEQAGKRVLDRAEFMIRVDLGLGDAEAAILTCDLSYDYVRINAEYRS